MNIRALTLGALVGFVVAFAPSCSPPKCGPQNCDGCCDSVKNTCVKKPNNNNNTTCGSAGNACLDCTATTGTCNMGQCSGTGAGGGGGGTTGGGGGTTGGGGGGCDGCRLPNGSCVPSQTSSSNTSNCGIGGVTCQTCATGELCNTGVCGMPPAMARVGSPCANDGECQSGLGAMARCKQTTTSGNGTYTGGYCTLPCGTSANQCPSGSTCVGLLPQYGEADTFCWDNCTATDRCRTPGYACYNLSSGAACWIDPIPPLDAGTPADKVGQACTSAMDCDNPPESGATCLSREFNFNWAGGYCSKADCLSNAECSSDGGAICLGFTQNDRACVQKCADSSDGGQSTCRNGYICNQYFTGLADGGQAPSADGFCAPPEAPTPTTIGGACMTDMDCQVPAGAIADCIPPTLPDGGPSGVPDGECTRFDCMADSDCGPADAGNQCFGLQAGGSACFKGCAQSGVGQSNCRVGYVCQAYTQADGGPSADGVCSPSCAVPGGGCSQGTCNSMGYCQ